MADRRGRDCKRLQRGVSQCAQWRPASAGENRRGEAERLAKTVVEVALIEETDRQRHLAHRQAAAEQALALLEPQPLEPGVGVMPVFFLNWRRKAKRSSPNRAARSSRLWRSSSRAIR